MRGCCTGVTAEFLVRKSSNYLEFRLEFQVRDLPLRKIVKEQSFQNGLRVGLESYRPVRFVSFLVLIAAAFFVDSIARLCGVKN